MTDFLLPFIITALIAVIIIQAVERYFFSEQARRERNDLLTYILSRNPREFNEAIKVDKISLKKNELNTDEVELSEATEEEFNRFLNH